MKSIGYYTINSLYDFMPCHADVERENCIVIIVLDFLEGCEYTYGTYRVSCCSTSTGQKNILVLSFYCWQCTQKVGERKLRG
jgi:hypothetical protein